MKNFFRFTLVVFVAVAVFFGTTSAVLAQKKDYGLSKTVQASGNLLPSKIAGAENVPQLIGAIVAAVLGFLGIIFFFLIFYAGIVWMTAQGQEEKIEKSKETISAAVIGLIIIMAAYALTQFIFDQLSARGTSSTVTTQTSGTGNNTLLCETITNKAQCTAEPGCAYLDPSGSTPGGCFTP